MFCFNIQKLLKMYFSIPHSSLKWNKSKCDGTVESQFYEWSTRSDDLRKLCTLWSSLFRQVIM